MLRKLLSPPIRNQYFAGFVVNLIAFVHGNADGWFSPALLTLNSPSTPLKDGPMTKEQMSYVASIVLLGSALGNLISGQITSRYGNRVALMSLGIPQLVWWGLVAVADHYWYLIIARVFVGYTRGNLFKVIPYFVADMSQADIRGKIGSMMWLMYNTGILCGFIVGEYVPYKYIPLSFVMSVIYIALVWFYIPETPPFSMSKGKKEKAFESLLFYRSVDKEKDIPDHVHREFTELSKFQDHQDSKENLTWRSFIHKDARSGILMNIFLASFVHLCGFFALMQFTSIIFVESGSSLPPNDAAIIVALIQIAGNVASIFVVERCGRKTLLISCCLSTAFCLGVLGTYSFLDEQGFAVDQYNWIPIFCFSGGIFSISLGIMSVLLTIMTEVLLPELKNQGMVIANMLGCIGGFAILMLFPIMLVRIQVYGVMWFFSASCLIGVVVFAIFLKETKGKNLNK